MSAAVAENLSTVLNVRKEDIFINLLDVTKEDYYLGNDIARFA